LCVSCSPLPPLSPAVPSCQTNTCFCPVPVSFAPGHGPVRVGSSPLPTPLDRQLSFFFWSPTQGSTRATFSPYVTCSSRPGSPRNWLYLCGGMKASFSPLTIFAQGLSSPFSFCFLCMGCPYDVRANSTLCRSTLFPHPLRPSLSCSSYFSPIVSVGATKPWNPSKKCRIPFWSHPEVTKGMAFLSPTNFRFVCFLGFTPFYLESPFSCPPGTSPRCSGLFPFGFPGSPWDCHRFVFLILVGFLPPPGLDPPPVLSLWGGLGGRPLFGYSVQKLPPLLFFFSPSLLCSGPGTANPVPHLFPRVLFR